MPIQIETQFEFREFETGRDIEVDFAAGLVLEELGIEIEEPETEAMDKLLERFEGVFPSTKVFSAFSRETLSGVIPQDERMRPFSHGWIMKKNCSDG